VDGFAELFRKLPDLILERHPHSSFRIIRIHSERINELWIAFSYSKTTNHI
jgi:hypothetical protein